jgi:hypothetical protein
VVSATTTYGECKDFVGLPDQSHRSHCSAARAAGSAVLRKKGPPDAKTNLPILSDSGRCDRADRPRDETGGQTLQQPNQDTLGALLVEVRGLRNGIEQLASVGPSIQLAMDRAQLQEHRIDMLVRRADVLRDALVAAHKRVGEMQDRVGNLQRALEGSSEPVHRSSIEAELPIVKQDLARAAAEAQRLQMEESEAAAQVSSEQARWAEINQRLEELDRALTRR